MKSTMFKFSLAAVMGAMLSCAIAVSAHAGSTTGNGKLFLVGTGPGAPDLISLRAVNCIKAADVVIAWEESAEKWSEYLEGKEFISLPHLRYWEILEKKCWASSEENQAACEKLLAERAERARMIREHLGQGKTVAVLEGGDPCIFGSLRWIKQEFKDDEFEVIPGISAFNATNALLKREVVDAYVAGDQTRSLIITTPLRQGDRYDSIQQLAKSRSTLVFFMPQGFEENVLPLLLKVYPPKTPVAIVRAASINGRQRIVYGTLENFPAQPPAEQWDRIIYVGEFLNDAYGKF